MRILSYAFALFTGLIALSPAASAALYPVEVESGVRTSVTGDQAPYDLYLPGSIAGHPAPPAPAVILTHGFAREKRYHEYNARYMAARGIVVMVPNLVRLFTEESQLRNIENTVDHAAWLLARSATPGDSLFGRIAARIGFAGHSAGGAVSFEAAIDAQRRGLPLAGVLLLDAVPWSRTLDRAGELGAVAFSNLTAEPAPCNAGNLALQLLPGLAFPSVDIRVKGATHCDPENPTDWLCRAVCGGSSPEPRKIFRRLMYLFFRDSFGLPEPWFDFQTYWQALITYNWSGKVVVTPTK